MVRAQRSEYDSTGKVSKSIAEEFSDGFGGGNSDLEIKPLLRRISVLMLHNKHSNIYVLPCAETKLLHSMHGACNLGHKHATAIISLL